MDLAGSPYTITSTVGVPAGVTLTIHPGVKVEGNFDLVVKGKIVANGSGAQLVEFTNLRVMFRSADLSLSTIRYVKFNNAGVQLADESQVQDVIKNSKTLIVRNCTFDNRGYVRARGSLQALYSGWRIVRCPWRTFIVIIQAARRSNFFGRR